MTNLDKAVLDFKMAVNKKALVIGVSTSRVFDFMLEDENRRKQALKKAWSLSNPLLRG